LYANRASRVPYSKDSQQTNASRLFSNENASAKFRRAGPSEMLRDSRKRMLAMCRCGLVFTKRIESGSTVLHGGYV
jgi:hypothetical protein